MNRSQIVILYAGMLFLLTCFSASCSGGSGPAESVPVDTGKRVLIFSATRGFRHVSIRDGVAAFRKLGPNNGFVVDASEDPELFNSENLKRYSAIVFLNTTGSFFNEAQKHAFREFIHQGGGFIGIHSATDTFYDWPWYAQLIGGYFKSHPEIQTATLNVAIRDHPATSKLSSPWIRRDEWYNFRSLSPNTTVLLTIDESTYKGGENGDHHPVSWYHEFEGGRVFYTALGHTRESYKEQPFLDHILGGLQWVLRADAGSR